MLNESKSKYDRITKCFFFFNFRGWPRNIDSSTTILELNSIDTAFPILGRTKFIYYFAVSSRLP